MKAVVNGDRIECGECGAKLAELKSINQGRMKSLIEIKCKHKENGQTCNAINEILL